MRSLEATWASAMDYAGMVAAATTNAELYSVLRAHAIPPDEYAARVQALGRRWHLLSMSEDWCGDSVNTLPWIDALAAASPLLEHRIIRRDEHPALMDAHLTNGRTRSIPIVMVLDEDLVERGWWGPRPRAVQAWFEGAEAQAMTKPERFKVLRTRYARDRGRAILDEVVALIESIAQPPAADADDPSAVATTQAAS